MRICHPNGVQGRRPIDQKKRKKEQKRVADLQKFLKQKPAAK
ncbi:hypothetical protein [Fructilactobacillus hinvesii]|nr:hypothetical protein [Fructilactobacillus hinvesii]